MPVGEFRQRPAGLNCAALDSFLLDDYPTFKRYVDDLRLHVPAKGPESGALLAAASTTTATTATDETTHHHHHHHHHHNHNNHHHHTSPPQPAPPPPPHHFKVSQLPPLPSSTELLRLQQELSALQAIMAVRAGIVGKNKREIDDSLPPEEVAATTTTTTAAAKGVVAPTGSGLITLPATGTHRGGSASGSSAATRLAGADHLGGGGGKVDKRKDWNTKKARVSSAAGDEGGERVVVTEPKIPKIKLRVPKVENVEEQLQFGTPDPPSHTKKRRRDKDLEEASENEDKKRANHGLSTTPTHKNATPSHRGTAPKTKPKSSKKSGAHKNNKLKKRHSVAIEDDDASSVAAATTAAQTPEPDENNTTNTSNKKVGQKSLEGDFTKAKTVQNQIPIATFWTFVDQFYRPLTEEDLKFLEMEGDEVTPYMTPPLGRPWKEQWADEDQKQLLELSAPQSSSSGFHHQFHSDYDLAVPPDATVNASGGGGGGGGGPRHMQALSDRIIASLMENRIIGAFAPRFGAGILPALSAGNAGAESEADVNAMVVDESAAAAAAGAGEADTSDLEHRMRTELRYIGLIDDEEIDPPSQIEPDEISADLAALQSRLRAQTSANRRRRRILLQIATKHMGFQEYNGVLDDINKNIAEAYMKRFRANAKSKSKKRVTRTIGGVNVGGGDMLRPLGETVLQHLKNRRRVVEELGRLLPHEEFGMPATSIYALPAAMTTTTTTATPAVGASAATTPAVV
ncbi:Transcriptional regulator [Geranomyces variabilis]|uniref:Transcriptional regulator n=1 Tax=Geranomyces variabilis TaxID=109894 RepID=A0AAD5XVN2_9FUNG|nr:Transcriptional regulator [Geranomyces variabilis]